MFTRLFLCATARNLCKLPKHIFVTQQHAAIPKYCVSQTQYLHVKVYDKDAGLEKKRDINKLSLSDETEVDHKFHKLQAKRGKTIAGSEVRSFELSSISKEKLDFMELEASHTLETSKHKLDPDVFGNASKEPVVEDEGDLAEEEYISRPTRRSKKLGTKEYAMIIKEHLKNHRVKEALEVLEIRMIKEDRVKPENYIYNLLISGCAKVGYTRMAFQLFSKMRKRGLKVKESTYTSLFNACANAPSRTDGLTRAIRLRELILEKGYEPNVKNYNAMIKTFGRWGDVKTAYILADEMREKKLEMTGETYNFLLQACASDENYGFRHCLLTWHKMLHQGIEPDYYSFNTVLRCVRDCGFGDLESMEKVLNQILDETQAKQITAKKINFQEHKEIESGINSTSSSTENKQTENSAITTRNVKSNDNSSQLQTENYALELPNLLAPQPHLGSMISLSEVEKPHERFLLLGGLTRFLEEMKSKNITPDIQTFTTMLEVIPPTNTAEKLLLTYIRKIGLKADIDFFNILIKKRAMRFDYEGGKEVLTMIRTAGLYPDIVTYGVLALGCTTAESSRELLQQMHQNGKRMNIAILGAMLRQGCAQKAFPYVCEIMQISLDENIKPNHIFLRHLHNFYIQCARAIDTRHPSTKTKSFKKDHMKFCDKYRLYQEEHGIDGLKLEDAIKKIKERPYDQYKEDDIEGLEPLKNQKLVKKHKMRKYIKKIKIKELRGDEDSQDVKRLPTINQNEVEKVLLEKQITTSNLKDESVESNHQFAKRKIISNSTNPFKKAYV